MSQFLEMSVHVWNKLIEVTNGFLSLLGNLFGWGTMKFPIWLVDFVNTLYPLHFRNITGIQHLHEKNYVL